MIKSCYRGCAEMLLRMAGKRFGPGSISEYIASQPSHGCFLWFDALFVGTYSPEKFLFNCTYHKVFPWSNGLAYSQCFYWCFGIRSGNVQCHRGTSFPVQTEGSTLDLI